MKILVLAPQPFYEERGTLIATDLLVRALCERGDQVDLLTFHLGANRRRPNLRIHRIRPWPRPRSVPPGLSVAKVWCDVFLAARTLQMARAGDYDLIHAVEEAGFIAMVVGRLLTIPFVLDMDSSMTVQIVDRYRWVRPARGLLDWLETLPMRRAIAAVPMCEELAVRARRYCRGTVHVLHDVSLISDPQGAGGEDIRWQLHLDGPIVQYIGNLEPYQGIALLLHAFNRVAATHPSVALVMIGGKSSDIAKYRRMANDLGLAERAYFLGPRPVGQLSHFMRQADLLVSPRIQGTNTPMKIYSYLDSGTPIVATNLPAHTQVLSPNEAALVAPDPDSLARAIQHLLERPEERQRLAANARELARSLYSWNTFRTNVETIFGELEARVMTGSR
jgi:glycosyltransferase involved in cell wall biosynthesis